MWSRIRSYIVWIASGVALNGLLFVLGTAIGAFGPSVLAKTTQQPLSIAPVIAASIFPAVIATAIRLVVGRLVRPWSRAQKYWRNITVLLLLLSFGSPVQGLSGHNTLSVVILCAMHVVSAVTIFMGLSWITRPRWTFGSDWSPKVTGNGELAVVTGATSGIGKAVALQLHDLGFNVVGVGRSATFPSAEMETSPRYRLITADLSSVKNAVQAGQSVVEFDNRPVHLVVHCAGTLKATTKQTEDGIDENFATSFLGRLALTTALKTDEQTRFVIVGAAESGRLSKGMQKPINSTEDIGTGLQAHGKAQLANDLWTARIKRLGFRAFGYGPGSVTSNIRREVPKLIERAMGVFFAPATRQSSDAARDIVRLLLDDSLPKSGFASRDGLFDHHPFIENVQNQDALFGFAQTAIEKQGESR